MRGSGRDFIIVAAIAIATFVLALPLMYMYRSLNSEFKTALLAAGAPTAEITQMYDNLEYTIIAYGNVVVWFVLILMGVSTILSAFVPNHPIFIVFTVFLLILSLVVVTIGKTAIDVMIQQEPQLASQIPVAQWFWENATKIWAFWGILDMAVMYFVASRGSRG